MKCSIKDTDAITRHVPVKYMTHEALYNQTGMCYYVWPIEGSHDESTGMFTFHDGTHEEGWDYPTSPLLVDSFSASAYKMVYDRIKKPDNKVSTKKYVEEHRGIFIGFIMEQIVYPNISKGSPDAPVKHI